MEPSGPLLVDTGRGLSIRYMDRWLYSRRDPTAAPLEAARSAAILPDTLYLAPSPCLCYGLAELVSRLPASSAALCVETDPRLRAIASRAVSEGLRAEAASGRVALCETREALSAYRALEAAVAARRFRRVVEVRLSGGRTVDERGYDGAIASVEADIGSRYRNRLSLVRMGRLWTKNLIANLGAMDWASVGPLRSGGKPVVACGAGPSLDSAIPYLRAARDSVFLLACDTAAGALAAAGLAPDAVVCLEGQVYNVADFLPLGAAASDEASPRAAVPGAVVDLSAHPSSFRALSGPKALTLSEWTDSAFLSRLSAAGLPVSAVPPLGSVGVLALRVAASLGGPIVVAGLDFSFYQGRTHCAGSPADLLSRRSETRTCKSAAAWDASFRDGRSRNGDGSLSDPALSMYASLAASELRLAAEQGVAAYDARGGLGAPLPATAPGEESLAGILRTARGACPEATFGSSADPELAAARARSFLEGELERAEAVAEALRRGSDDARLRSMLAEADFLYMHFPDPERVALLEDDALRRVAAEAAYWRGRLEDALSGPGDR